MDINVNITNKLLAVTQILEKTGDVIFAQFRTTFTGYEILKHINAGTTTTTALAKTMNSTLSSITHKTKVLEESGFIERSFDKNDKRIWYFAITKEGRTSLKLIESIYQEALKQLYSEFTNSQKQQVFDFLNKIENHLNHALLEHKTEFVEFVKGLLKSRPVNSK